MTNDASNQPPVTGRSIVLTLLLLGTGCLFSSQSHAAAKGSWSENVSRDQSFSRVLIVGISPDFNQRCRFERALASSIRSEQTEAIVSCDEISSDTPLSRESVEAAVAARGADAVLATSLVSQSWDVNEGGTIDTRGNADYKAVEGWYGFYGNVIGAEFRTSAPVTNVKGKAHVTTELYETDGATIVYTVQTKVRNIESSRQGLAEAIGPLTKRLRKDGLIR